MNALLVPKVKVISFILFLLGTSFAAANDPASAALSFLEKVRQRNVDLTPGKDTALSPHTTNEKRNVISKRLERLADDLGKGPLEAAEVKIDDGFAGVIVRNANGFDPAKMQVTSIALVKIKDAWLPAPVPSSFENTGSNLAQGIRERLIQLESWMMKGQAEELTELREASRERMQKDIRAAMDPTVLTGSSPEKVVEQFMAACQKRDLPSVLGFLGGLQQALPHDWTNRLLTAETAMLPGKKIGWPWRLLIAQEVIRVPVKNPESTGDPIFSFACLDPAGRGVKMKSTQVEILTLELDKDVDGLWKVNLPPSFFLGPDENEYEDESEADLMQEMLETFPAELRKKIPVNPQESIEAAATALTQAFQTNDLKSLLSLINLEGEASMANHSCALAARFWWQVHNPEARRMVIPLAHREFGNAGVAAYQFFSPREPNLFDLKTFYFEKTPKGWLLMPELKLPNSRTEDQISVRNWTSEQTKEWRGNWQPTLMSESAKLESIPEGNAPTEEDAKTLVEGWLAATHAADIRAALQKVVYIDRHGELSRTLQNLGYELSTAFRDEGKFSLIHHARGKTWTVIGVKSETGSTDTYPLYLVISTPQGPRILISCDLFGEGTSGRQKLNEVVLKRASELTTPNAAEELRSLLEAFKKEIQKK